MKFVLVQRFALYALVWLVLSGGDRSGLVFGAVAAAGAAWASARLQPPDGHRLSLPGLLALLPGFLRASLLGGIDVAWRALHPRMPINAGWLAYRTALPRGLPRTSFGSETSLLPGSLVAGGRGDVLVVHCLDRGAHVHAALRAEERRIAAALVADAPARPERA